MNMRGGATSSFVYNQAWVTQLGRNQPHRSITSSMNADVHQKKIDAIYDLRAAVETKVRA